LLFLRAYFAFCFVFYSLVLVENNPTTPPPHANDQSSPTIDTPRTNISSSIGPAASTPSPSSTRHYKPVSLTSTQTYFQNIQQHGTSPILQAKKIPNQNENKETITILTRPGTSAIKHGEKKDTIATVRFKSDKPDENGTNIQETYL
jgi:hypothetical protein